MLAFGDFGDGSDPQKQVAGAMLRTTCATVRLRADARRQLLLAGDGEPERPTVEDLVERPVRSAADPVLRLPREPRLGPSDSPAAEILFAQQSPSWRMPAAYTGSTPVPQFFALDTDMISEEQLLWLTEALDKARRHGKSSTATTRFIGGRHEDNNKKITQLLPAPQGSRRHLPRRA